MRVLYCSHHKLSMIVKEHWSNGRITYDVNQANANDPYVFEGEAALCIISVLMCTIASFAWFAWLDRKHIREGKAAIPELEAEIRTLEGRFRELSAHER